MTDRGIQNHFIHDDDIHHATPAQQAFSVDLNRHLNNVVDQLYTIRDANSVVIWVDREILQISSAMLKKPASRLMVVEPDLRAQLQRVAIARRETETQMRGEQQLQWIRHLMSQREGYERRNQIST